MRQLITATAAALMLSAPAFADSHGTGYMADELLVPCRDADSDARELGQAAEVQCEQYILGYVDALTETGAAGPGTDICPPAENTADEVRWAFVRWVYGSYSERKAMPASDAMLGTLKDEFPCSQ